MRLAHAAIAFALATAAAAAEVGKPAPDFSRTDQNGAPPWLGRTDRPQRGEQVGRRLRSCLQGTTPDRGVALRQRTVLCSTRRSP